MSQKPRQAFEHDANRSKVCVVCMQKAKYPVTDSICHRIKTYFIENFDPSEPCVPNGICSKCRSDLSDISTGKKYVECLPAVYNFSQILPEYSRCTRANPNGLTLCNCEICHIARQKLTTIPHRKLGRPPNTSSSKPDSLSPTHIVRLCCSCLSPVGRGLSHKCNVLSLRNNVTSMCLNQDSITKDLVATSIIKEKAGESSTLELHSGGRHSLKLQVGKENTPVNISARNLNSLQTSLSLSNTSMKNKVVPFLRSVLGGKSKVESECEKYFQQRDCQLSDFFTLDNVQFDVKGASHSDIVPIVFCNDIPALIKHVCETREIEFEATNVKFGIDGGGGFLKVCLTIMLKEVETRSRKTIDRTHRFSSVKKLLIIAIVPDIPETYGNMMTIFNLLDINQLDFDFTYAVDLKLANILGGIQAHGSSYPCVWCEAPKCDFGTEKARSYPVRSLGSVKQKSQEYHNQVLQNPRKTQAKDFTSCVHKPLLSGEDSDIFIKNLPPPELHLLLRITNRIFKALKAACTISAMQWLDKLGIQVPMLHSGEMNGNMCRRLLKKTRVLADILITNNQQHLMIFVQVLESFNTVVQECFGDILNPKFKESITTFSIAFQKLAIPTTTAVHVLQVHVPQFCLFKKESLGKFSEQASEAVHRDFCEIWNQCGKVGLNNERYGSNLLQTVVRYNGRHLI